MRSQTPTFSRHNASAVSLLPPAALGRRPAQPNGTRRAPGQGNDGAPAPVRAFARPRCRMVPESAHSGVHRFSDAGAVSAGCRVPVCRVRSRCGIEARRRRAGYQRRVDALRRTGEDRPRSAPDGVLHRDAGGVDGRCRPDPAAETGVRIPRGHDVVCLLGGALGHRTAGAELSLHARIRLPGGRPRPGGRPGRGVPGVRRGAPARRRR